MWEQPQPYITRRLEILQHVLYGLRIVTVKVKVLVSSGKENCVHVWLHQNEWLFLVVISS